MCRAESASFMVLDGAILSRFKERSLMSDPAIVNDPSALHRGSPESHLTGVLVAVAALRAGPPILGHGVGAPAAGAFILTGLVDVGITAGHAAMRTPRSTAGAFSDAPACIA
jgi:hypothetical protein